MGFLTAYRKKAAIGASGYGFVTKRPVWTFRPWPELGYRGLSLCLIRRRFLRSNHEKARPHQGTKKGVGRFWTDLSWSLASVSHRRSFSSFSVALLGNNRSGHPVGEESLSGSNESPSRVLDAYHFSNRTAGLTLRVRARRTMLSMPMPFSPRSTFPM